MHLDKLEIKGFKSFKDKTVLEFPDNFTAIVGPNGSGKSNVIDAVCFVLGRSRGLRVNNISELICNGGTGAKECDSAKVVMYLSDPAGKSIKLSREIDRTGKSVYRMDDKVTTKQEIVDVMGDNEYNIILQSDVNKVIDMKPKERRKIIDDLCGIGEYDAKKEKAINELEKVEAKIAEVNIITGEKQGYLEQLGKERDEAMRFQTLQDDQKKAQATILHLEVEDHEKREARIRERLDKIKAEREADAARIREIKAAIEIKNNSLRETNSRIFDLEEERGGTKLLELKNEITRAGDRLEALAATEKSFKTEISEKKKKKQAVTDEEKKLDSEHRKITQKLWPLDEKIEEESKKQAAAGYGKELDELKTGLFDVKAKISAAQEIAARDEAEVASLKEEKKALEERIKESLKDEKELARGIDDHLMKNKSGFQEYEGLKTEIPVIEKKYRELSKDFEEVQMRFAEKKSELATIERTSDNLSRSVSSVMNLKAIIPGIYGPVSQLGNVSNAGYAKAMHIAAGGRLENVVVENEDVAAKCIEYLRKQRIGRATFLPLSKINAKLEEEAPKGSIGFCRDYITTPHKFEKIFEYVYGDTVLVKDIDAAKKTGIGRWRMVSLDGDLITREGAMTGGFTKEVAIKFSSTEELEKEIKALEKETIKLDGERQELELRKKRIEERINGLEDLVSSGKTGLEKTRLEKESLASRRNEFSQRAAELEKRIEGLEKKVSEGHALAKKLSHEAEGREKKLEKALKDAPAPDTGLLDSLREERHALDIERSRIEEKKSLSLVQQKELESEIANLEKEHKELEENLKKAHEQAAELNEKYKTQENENKRLMEDIERLITGRSMLEEEITKISTESGKLEYAIAKCNEEAGKQEVELAKVETKLIDLRKSYEVYAGVTLMEGKSSRALQELLEDIDKQLAVFGSVNMRAIDSYETLKKEIDDISAKLETLKNERQSIFDFMETVETKKRETFTVTFEIIRKNFERIFKEISAGEGTLILDNPREISECGLLITASPKGKKLLSLDLMSGGEKVLTTSAFLLAIQQYKPSHFYIVDELDAALDRENSTKLAEMLAKTDAQFLMITHNDTLMKYAKSVIGVSMNGGVSQVVGVKLA